VCGAGLVIEQGFHKYLGEFRAGDVSARAKCAVFVTAYDCKFVGCAVAKRVKNYLYIFIFGKITLRLCSFSALYVNQKP